MIQTDKQFALLFAGVSSLNLQEETVEEYDFGKSIGPKGM
jgi:hypothetical protein